MLRYVLDVMDLLDSPDADGEKVAAYLTDLGADPATLEVEQVSGPKGKTQFVRVTVPGRQGKTVGGAAPTLGIVGRLGGVGARPDRIGLVSDGDGAVAALSAAAKLVAMCALGDVLPGDVVIGTHVCPDAPTEPHEPVAFMGSPVDMATANEHELTDAMDAVISIDTTKGNNVISHRGIALSPTVWQGYILRVSDDLARILETVTGLPAVTFPISTQDITPYGNGVYHLNSILQPAVATEAPVVGLAITTVTAVPGCGTGASHETDIALAARFAVEVAKEFGFGTATLADEAEFRRLHDLYGSLSHLQTVGRE
jgi:hypothetical protein